MLQFIAFVLAIAVVFAIKAVVIVRQHEELVQDSTAFSWMRPRSYEDIVAEAHEVEEEYQSALQGETTVAMPRVAVHA